MGASAIIVAAGRGSRLSDTTPAGKNVAPKQYQTLNGRPVLTHAIDVFAGHPGIDRILVAIHADDAALYQAAIAKLATPSKLMTPVVGGATRQASVSAALAHLDATGARQPVLVHDAARPFISHAIIDRVLTSLTSADAVTTALPVADTLQRVGSSGQVVEAVPRDGLWRAQTPQGFAFDTLIQAHQSAAHSGRLDFTDDASLVAWAGGTVLVTDGSERNIKITTQEDLQLAETQFAKGPSALRIGSGFDVHRTVPGDNVWLCGLEIPAPFALSGHSDADVALHALTDAIFGALGDGDIGSHFPPSDPQWKGAASHIFLETACQRMRERGAEIANVDITIICETPKIGPHRDAMRQRVADILAVPVEAVSVKATTSEQLGFTGRGEGIAAQATALLAFANASK